MTTQDPWLDLSGDFGLNRSRAWLNTAHQGALPLVAAQEAREAIAWKLQPDRLTTDRFGKIPRDLRAALGELIGVSGEEIILTNGASYGIHLLANGIPLEADDEILLMKGDFPSNLLPWKVHEEKGVRVRALAPSGHVLQVEELADALTPRTKLMCLSWVHSFSGRVLDIEQIGRLCRSNGTWLIVNVSQGVGARRLDVGKLSVDAIVCAGWKWLCGPYGTGFAWMRERLRASLRYNQAYWQAAQSETSLRSAEAEIRIAPPEDPRRYDLFGTANFFNFMPFRASVRYLLDQGRERIESHVQALVERLVGGLDPGRFDLISDREGITRSSIVVLSHRDPSRNPVLYDRLAHQGLDVALRLGRIRVSPHLYNLPGEIDRLLSALHAQ